MITVFKGKLKVITHKATEGKTASFPTLNLLLEDDLLYLHWHTGHHHALLGKAHLRLQPLRSQECVQVQLGANPI
jgi:hypothetical protein